MFEFFLALFGGIFWGGKYVSEKCENRAYEKKNKLAHNINEIITATSEQEVNLRNSLISDNRFILLQSIAPELSEVYGDAWYREFSNVEDFDTQYSWVYYPWGTAFHLLLAKQGLKPIMFSYNYKLAGGGEITNRIVKVCELIEKNMQKFHPELKMIFIPEQKSYKDNTFYEELYRGTLWWEHNATFLGGKHKIPTRYLW